MKTRQEIFTTAYLGLQSQGFVQSTRVHGGMCMYRGTDGRKCAIGHCIEDKDYLPIMDSGAHDAAFAAAGIVDTPFGKALQSIHDTTRIPEKMRAALHRFAEQNELEVPSV